MAMTIWNEVADLERSVDDFFRGFGWPRPLASWWPRVSGGPFMPVADVFQRKGDLVVRLELPGIDPEKDVKVTLEKGHLVISGERRQKTEIKEEDYYRMESCTGSFLRRLPVPDGIDESKIKATYTDGVLEIVVQGGVRAQTLPAGKAIPVKSLPPKAVSPK